MALPSSWHSEGVHAQRPGILARGSTVGFNVTPVAVGEPVVGEFDGA